MLVGLVPFVGCAQKGKISYTVDGDTPQEKYTATLTKGRSQLTDLHFYRNEMVNGFKHRSNSRVAIAQEFLISIKYTNGIACGDTAYNFIPKDEVYTYSVKFKNKVVPNYYVLLRDLVKYGGVQCDTTYAPAYMLTISDTAVYNNSVCRYAVRSRGNYNKYDERGNWRYVDLVSVLEGHPQMLASIVSALRYYWHIPVLVNPLWNTSVYLESDESDFSNPDLSFDQVQEMLQKKYGMKMVPAGREMPILTYSVK